MTRTVSLSRSFSSSAMISPWKFGCSKTRTMSCTGPTAMRSPPSGWLTKISTAPSAPASPRRDERVMPVRLAVGGLPDALKPRHEQGDDGDEVELAEQRFDDGKCVAE